MPYLFEQKCTNESCNKTNKICIEEEPTLGVNYEYDCPSCKNHIIFPVTNAFVMAKVQPSGKIKTIRIVSNIPNNAIIAKKVQNIE